MRFASSISDATTAEAAIHDVVAQAKEQLAGTSCQLACLFVSLRYQAAWLRLLPLVQTQLHADVLMGCSGIGLVGGERELEAVPAISLVAAHLPGVKLSPFVITPEELAASGPGGYWIDKVGVSPERRPLFILLSDPYTTDTQKLLAEFNVTYRTAPIVGGLVSGGEKAGQRVLFHGLEVASEGAVGVALTGNIAMESVVAPACRPLGRPYVITSAQDNVIWQLGGRSAMDILNEAVTNSSPIDRTLAQQGSLFVGVVINEMRQSFGPGDFVIRHVVGIDPRTGGLAIADRIRVGQTVQFHLLDPATARRELRRLLTDPQEGIAKPAGGLIFNCAGRGTSLYREAHHDLKTVRALRHRVPLGGVFCQGEIGPLDGINTLHGYTASVGLFRPVAQPAVAHRSSQPLEHTT